MPLAVVVVAVVEEVMEEVVAMEGVEEVMDMAMGLLEE